MIFFGIFIFLLLSALFSGAEIAFVSASKLRIELKKSEGSAAGRIIAEFYKDSRDFIGTMLVGNNITLVILTYLLSQLLYPQLLVVSEQPLFLLIISTVIITIVVLIFGEFLPKTFFGLYPNEALQFFAYPLLFFKYLLSAPVWLVSGMSSFILKYIIRTKMEVGEKAFTKIDLENFIRGTSQKHDEEIDTELFENALHFNKVKVKECMIPRKEIIMVDVSDTVPDLIQLFKETGLSRVVVIDDDVDNILGYVHHQQLLKNPRSVRQILRTMPFVPEAMPVYELMNRFIRERSSMACVVDEYGGTAGLITMEDILEELFGDIVDEHDKEEYIEITVSENEYVFSGRLEMGYLNEKYEDLDLPEGEYSTLSGYIVMTAETIPEEGSSITLGNFRFVLESVSDTRIETVRVIKLNGEDE
ncbi:MAG: HlyC/CorC family transporter [Saprospiraceae bacterium]|nr:HlyC/CorC family transporter [Saprospiraceae bacterium]